MSGMRTTALAGLSVLAVIGTGTVVIASGAVGEPAKTSDDPIVAGQPVSETSTKTGSLASLYKSVQDGVAFIQAGQASGSGFVIDTEGHIVTNDHVVADATSYQVRLGEKGKLVNATLVGADPSTDLAILKVDPADTGTLHPIELGDSDDVQVGQSVIAIGSPYGLSGTLTSGIVSALNRDIQSPGGQTISGAIQTDAAINPGNSGGPLLDRKGRVLGVNAQIATASGGSAGVGFAIPISIVKAAIPKLEAGEGLEGQTQTPDQSQQQLQVPDQSQDPSQGQADPYGDQSQADPYGQQSDPYGEQSQADPYGQQADPYGQDDGSGSYGESDPYGQQADPYGDQAQSDPYGALLGQAG